MSTHLAVRAPRRTTTIDRRAPARAPASTRATPATARRPLYASIMAALTVLGAGVSTPAAAASPYDSTTYLGDSLTDSGYFDGFLGFQKSRTTNPDPVWAEILSERLGGNGAAAWRMEMGGLVRETGGNYAVSGARIETQGRYTSYPSNMFIKTVNQQLDELLTRTPTLKENGLYPVWAGANDIIHAITTRMTTLANPATQAGAIQEVLGDTTAAANATVALVDRLHAAGAGTVMVMNLPDIGATPAGAAAGPGRALMSGASTQFNTLLNTQLANHKGELVMLNVHDLFREVIADPARYGLTNVTDVACTSKGLFGGDVDSGLCTRDTLVEPDANATYLFADQLHPTGVGHRYLTDYTMSVLQAPGRMGMLAEAPLAGQRIVERTVAQRLFDRGTARGAKSYAQYEYANDSQRGGNAAWAPGMRNGIHALSLGVDYSATGQWLLGANLNHARHDATLGGASGSFNLNQTTVSAYTQYRMGDLAASLTGSAGILDYGRTSRNVNIGPASFKQRGSTQGTMAALTGALRYDAVLGGLTLSPTASVSAQRVHVSGFEERSGGARTSSSMYYRAQSRYALISSIGLQASAAIEGNGYTLKPFAGVAWEHDGRADNRRRVHANVAGMSGSFSQLTYAPTKSATVASAGLAFSLGRSTEGRVAYYGRYAKLHTSHGAQIGLTHRF
ncbi:MAG: autotransporter domain-containing protein [Burkholderiaceae bacterium]|nr:autotransporter domain-containing protein [Burkholderiaceae bacterium]